MPSILYRAMVVRSIHDCWAFCFSYQHCGHGLFGSHLMRELTFIAYSNGYAWTRSMKRLLKENSAKASKSGQKELPDVDVDYANLQKRFRNIMTRSEKELPPAPPKLSGKRGYCSPKIHMSHLLTIALNEISEWPR